MEYGYSSRYRTSSFTSLMQRLRNIAFPAGSGESNPHKLLFWPENVLNSSRRLQKRVVMSSISVSWSISTGIITHLQRYARLIILLLWYLVYQNHCPKLEQGENFPTSAWKGCDTKQLQRGRQLIALRLERREDCKR